MMRDQRELAELLRRGGMTTVAYVDGRGPRPQTEEEVARDAVTDRLRELGADERDVTAIAQALLRTEGAPSPSARYLLARDGRLEVDEIFAGPRLGSERFARTPLPEILPLLRHLARDVRYLVVETGREGAEVRLERGERHEAERVEDIEGRSDSLTKVQAGGWSHARYQRSAEEVWKHNQSEVAEAVDRIVAERRPAFLVLAGDVRARQVLRDRLGEAARRMLTEYDAHTRADGADDEGLTRLLSDLAERCIRDEIESAIDRARAGDGESGAEGVDAVLVALQQARVDVLVLDARLSEDGRTLLALDAQPWISRDEHHEFDASPLGRVPIAEGLARAALLTGARVLVREEEFGSPDEPRAETKPLEPIAALRWSGAGQ